MKLFKKKVPQTIVDEQKHLDVIKEIEYKNIKNYKIMMVRNDRIKIFGRTYIITNIDYTAPHFEEGPGFWFLKHYTTYITLLLVDDMSEIKKEITLTINEFEHYLGWDKYKNKED